MNKDFLETYLNTPTPTGSEHAGMMLLGRRIKEIAGIQPTIDVHGNLHAVYDVGAKTTVMLEGHGDEIGYIVEYVDANGFVYFQPLGGVSAPASTAERVRIFTKSGVVNGVFGLRPPHLMSADERKSAADNLKKLPCDIGAKSREEALSIVSIGDSAIVDAGFRALLGTRFSARALDNRIGSYAMMEAFIRLVTGEIKPKVNLHFVSSVAEEIGLVGGKLASYNVHPTIGISCDVAFAGDVNTEDAKVIGDLKLGGGVALARGPIYHEGLRALFAEAADEVGISYQVRAVPKGAGNNGWSLKTEHGGAVVVQLGIPLRYMHSPVEVADMRDVDSTIDITVAAILKLGDETILLPEQP